jgi:hypothetical protein
MLYFILDTWDVLEPFGADYYCVFAASYSNLVCPVCFKEILKGRLGFIVLQ